MRPRTNAEGTTTGTAVEGTWGIAAGTAAGTVAGTAAGTEVLPRCFSALMLDALTPHARQAAPP